MPDNTTVVNNNAINDLFANIKKADNQPNTAAILNTNIKKIETSINTTNSTLTKIDNKLNKIDLKSNIDNLSTKLTDSIKNIKTKIEDVKKVDNNTLKINKISDDIKTIDNTPKINKVDKIPEIRDNKENIIESNNKSEKIINLLEDIKKDNKDHSINLVNLLSKNLDKQNNTSLVVKKDILPNKDITDDAKQRIEEDYNSSKNIKHIEKDVSEIKSNIGLMNDNISKILKTDKDSLKELKEIEEATEDNKESLGGMLKNIGKAIALPEIVTAVAALLVAGSAGIVLRRFINKIGDIYDEKRVIQEKETKEVALGDKLHQKEIQKKYGLDTKETIAKQKEKAEIAVTEEKPLTEKEYKAFIKDADIKQRSLTLSIVEDKIKKTYPDIPEEMYKDLFHEPFRSELLNINKTQRQFADLLEKSVSDRVGFFGGFKDFLKTTVEERNIEATKSLGKFKENLQKQYKGNIEGFPIEKKNTEKSREDINVKDNKIPIERKEVVREAKSDNITILNNKEEDKKEVVKTINQPIKEPFKIISNGDNSDIITAMNKSDIVGNQHLSDIKELIKKQNENMNSYQKIIAEKKFTTSTTVTTGGNITSFNTPISYI